MASIWVPEAYAVFSSNGTADGYAVVADNSKFYPSAECFVSADGIDGVRAVITDLISSTKVGIRVVGEFPNRVPTYGRSPMVAFTTALNAAISMPGQVVRVEQPTFQKIPQF